MVKLFYADIEPLKNTCWRDVLPALPLWRQKRTLEMARDPDAARAAGMSFPELCTALIEYALA